ncbi:unnamed protein product [Rotaria sp. Silwood1]|nr:unnamed protein product [Rotaria sp. Silwood1]
MEHESSKRSRSFSISRTTEKENVTVLNARTLRQPQTDEITSSTNDLSVNSQQEESFQDEISKLIFL